MHPALLIHKDRLRLTPATRESTVHRSPIVPKSPWADMKKSEFLAKFTCTDASREVVLITCCMPELLDAWLTCQPQLQSVAFVLVLAQPETRLICKRWPHCNARTLASCRSLKSCWRTLSMRARSCHRQTLGRVKPTKTAETLKQTITSNKVKPWNATLGRGGIERAKKKKPSKYTSTC